ncbi:D-alanyl-lipoteichoic acid biosynthesis protein DltB [Clostridium botulinum]|uniref:D-alanyl-lipoteichoic acid biosynthesis protein DltB n=1 Tax=Clostridium botulinum TaxID=1491 RepID=UPI000360C16E|nr:D-alanyl-lipoteichoic acid biosynthesis protein DltB [Clostridium botulinum]MBN1036679.1 D-alanyl-lipoteichoic acid biosynthesis protein DltB [Clostridium botulinum]HBJ1647262.1 D-alanyl-lipoteichoic acid biosynthesis protein DltB [Clostridium botulinum]
MTLTQYGDYFYLYILMISLIPAIILGILQKNIKYYGAFLSLGMIGAIIGFRINKIIPLILSGDFYKALKSPQSQILLFLIFVIGEILLIKIYYQVRKKTQNKYVYYIALFCSMIPLIISKISPMVKLGTIGFIGLSYLNFKAIQMIIEIYDGTIRELSILKTIYFFIFFPTLSSGPVDRSRRFCEDLEKNIDRIEYINNYLIIGIQHIFKGILYKFIIAALISSLWMEKIPTEVTVLNGWNYMYSYSLYLFFDFAGYSAFAVGTSYILGIRVPENFNKPFLSKDMKEFWTRWHISLSKWFGDYIYSRFVLNSMRKKRFKNRMIASHVAQIITMGVMGVWHGLESFYIIYGLYQGLVLVFTDMYQRKSKFYKEHKKEKWFQYIQIIITFHIACFGLLIFSGYLFKK